MPVMDGYETVAWLQTQNYKQPVIALTAHAYEDEEALLDHGFTGYLRKPITLETLLKTVTEHLSLEIHYKEEIVEPRSVKNMLPQQIDISTSWLQQMRIATAELNPNQIINLAQQVNHEHPRLTATLITLVENYHLDKIADWLDKLQIDNSDR
jgi:DNA-binding response OmpR family regulator